MERKLVCFLCQDSITGFVGNDDILKNLQEFNKFTKEVGSKMGEEWEGDNMNTISTNCNCCSDCSTLIDSVMEEKEQVDFVEAGVRKLQLGLLMQLRSLQERLTSFRDKMILVRGRICMRGNKRKSCTNQGQLKKAVVNAVEALKNFNDDITSRVNVRIQKNEIPLTAGAANEEDIYPVIAVSDLNVKVEQEAEMNSNDDKDDPAPSDNFSNASSESDHDNEDDGPSETLTSDEEFSPKRKPRVGRNRRKRTVKREPKTELKCETCGAKFYSMALFKRHQEIGHRDTKYTKFHHCQFCKLAYRRKKDLKAHLATSHIEHVKKLPRVRVKKYKCTVCGFACPNGTQLRNHQETHLNPNERKKINCEFCGRSIFPKCYADHKRNSCSVRPEGSTDEGIICEQCGKSFKTRMALGQHVSYMHKRKDTTFTCRLCGREGIKTKQLLAGHMRCHTDKWEYVCQTCGRYFKFATDLRKHEKRCDGNKAPRKFRADVLKSAQATLKSDAIVTTK